MLYKIMFQLDDTIPMFTNINKTDDYNAGIFIYKKVSHISSFLWAFFYLTHCGLVMPYGDRSESTLAQVMACCRTAPSPYLNLDWSSVKPSDIHIRAISEEMPQPVITKIHLKITYLKFHSNFPGANELIVSFHGFQEQSLSQLMDEESKMVKNIRSLDSDMQTLVYENYNKFISATDTIRKVSVYEWSCK